MDGGDRSAEGPWRCVLLSGPAGAGKTTMCRLGHRAMVAAWGHPAAAIDVDQLYANVDPLWELPYSDERNDAMLAQAGQLAVSLFEHGWRTVMICGNSLFDPSDTATIVRVLCPLAEIYHVTLTPSVDAVLRRSAGAGRDPERVRRDVELHESRAHPGTARLDNSSISARESLSTLAQLVRRGAGRLRCPADRRLGATAASNRVD